MSMGFSIVEREVKMRKGRVEGGTQGSRVQRSGWIRNEKMEGESVAPKMLGRELGRRKDNEKQVVRTQARSRTHTETYQFPSRDIKRQTATHGRMHARTQYCTHPHSRACMHAPICTHACTHPYARTHPPTHTDTHACTYAGMHAQTHAHTRTHIPTHTNLGNPYVKSLANPRYVICLRFCKKPN